MRVDVSGIIAPESCSREPDQTAAGVQHLNEYMDTCQIDHCFVANRALLDGGETGRRVLCNEADGNAAMLDLAESRAGLTPLYVVTRRPLESNPTVFLGAMLSGAFAGAFFAPLVHHFDPLDDSLNPYWQTLARMKRPAMMLTGAKSTIMVQRVQVLARQHPGIAFILCGAMRDGVRETAIASVAKSREKGDSQLLLDCSYADAAQVINCIRSLGVDRIVYGSLAPIHGERHTDRRAAVMDELQVTLPEDAFHKLMGGTAARLFGLSAAAPAPHGASIHD